jgi:hypothetical protein
MSDSAYMIATVRNSSAVVPADANTHQRRQLLDLPFLNAPNMVNVDKRPSRLVRIEKVSGSIAHAHIGVPPYVGAIPGRETCRRWYAVEPRSWQVPDGVP